MSPAHGIGAAAPVFGPFASRVRTAPSPPHSNPNQIHKSTQFWHIPFSTFHSAPSSYTRDPVNEGEGIPRAPRLPFQPRHFSPVKALLFLNDTATEQKHWFPREAPSTPQMRNPKCLIIPPATSPSGVPRGRYHFCSGNQETPSVASCTPDKLHFTIKYVDRRRL